MGIQTSFFGSKAPRDRKVCIAKYPPRAWAGPEADKLAPSNPKAEDWQNAYRRDLESRFPTPSSLRLYLQGVERSTPNPILCCYEQKPEQCHRSILAAFVKEMINWDIKEWGSEGPSQGALFDISGKGCRHGHR